MGFRWCWRCGRTVGELVYRPMRLTPEGTVRSWECKDPDCRARQAEHMLAGRRIRVVLTCRVDPADWPDGLVFGPDATFLTGNFGFGHCNGVFVARNTEVLVV